MRMLDPFLSLSQTMPYMPPASWWLAPLVLFLLGTLAVIDALTSKVPDPLILPSLILITVVQGYYVEWTFAGSHMLTAFAAAFTIFLLNEIWFRIGKRDALGMGDAKWTMLAVVCFGLPPALIAWGVGAILAVGWIGLARVANHPIKRVHFAPFLFFGLLAGIWWLRLRTGVPLPTGGSGQ